MSSIDLASYLLRAVLYAASLWALTLVAWSWVQRHLPRTPGSLRLASVVLTLFAVNACVVEALGLAGILATPYYLAACAGLFVVAARFSGGRRLHASLVRLLRRQLWLWSRPRTAAPVAAPLLLLHLGNALLVDGGDSTTLHGPWIVDMVQQGRLLLETQFNYPLLWEMQYVPAFMILGSDTLAVMPKALAVLAALLAVGATARRLGVPGTGARMVAWLCLLLPVHWGANTLKNDTVLGVGLLVALMAAERAYRRRRGGLFLALLGGFVLVGSKATGFVYAALLVGLVLALEARNAARGARIRRLAAVVPLAVAVLSVAGVQQIATWLRTGSPVYPIALTVGGIDVFPGPLSLAGTSILEHLDDPETWTELLAAPSTAAGPEYPLVFLGVIAAWAASGLALVRRRRVGERPNARTVVMFAGCSLLFGLWLAYLATPLTRGMGPADLLYLRRGHSLRFAAGQLLASYVVAAAFVAPRIGPRFYRFLGFALTLLMLFKSYRRMSSFTQLRPELAAGAAILGVLVLAAFLLRRGAVLGTRLPNRLRPALLAAAVLASLAVFRHQVELTRQTTWLPTCRSVWTFVRERVPPASRIAVSAPDLHYRYVLYGERLNNVLLAPPDDGSLEGWLERTGVGFLYYAIRGWKRGEDTERLDRLRRRGWAPAGDCLGGSWVLLELAGSGSS